MTESAPASARRANEPIGYEPQRAVFSLKLAEKRPGGAGRRPLSHVKHV